MNGVLKYLKIDEKNKKYPMIFGLMERFLHFFSYLKRNKD